MSIDHNRIKVSDLETNQPNKILITNEQGELEFSDVSEESQNLQAVLDIGSSATGRTITLNSADTSAYPNLNSIEIGAGYSKKSGAYDWYGQNQAAETFISSNQFFVRRDSYSNHFILRPGGDYTNTFYAPDKTGGVYTLATLDDITSDFKTINGESIVGTGNIDLSNKQDISNQIEIGTSQVIPNSWHGKTVLFTASCTLTIPASLVASFIFNGITLPGVTVTWAITAPHTWLFGTPASTSEKQIFTLTKRGATNSILLLGV